MSKERKAPGTSETIVTSEGVYYQLPLVPDTPEVDKLAEYLELPNRREHVWSEWHKRFAACGYPVWPNSTAFYLGDINDLLYWIETHHNMPVTGRDR